VHRVAGVVVHEGKVLLMRRRNRGKEYYTFPGGGIEKGETPESALMRELREETSIAVTPKKLLYTVMWDDDTEEFFYLCSFVSGEPKLADDSIEKEVMKKDTEQYYEPLWMELSRIPILLAYPLEVRDYFIKDVRSNFEVEPRNIALERGHGRQEL
jgi:8-oxo-dGTP diphosphatase